MFLLFLTDSHTHACLASGRRAHVWLGWVLLPAAAINAFLGFPLLHAAAGWEVTFGLLLLSAGAVGAALEARRVDRRRRRAAAAALHPDLAPASYQKALLAAGGAAEDECDDAYDLAPGEVKETGSEPSDTDGSGDEDSTGMGVRGGTATTTTTTMMTARGVLARRDADARPTAC